MLLRALAEQGIIALISSDGPPPAFLKDQVGKRFVHCTETELAPALAFLAKNDITAADEAAGGEGI